jgi:ElaB/YqjD/DUF883 family membrane-anchored ribosome-binding protein
METLSAINLNDFQLLISTKEKNMESEMNRNMTNEHGSSSAENILNQTAQTYQETKRKVGRAYDRSAQAIEQTYDHAMDYGRNNPGKTVMIAFGVGLGVGMLLLGSSRRSRMSRYGEPIVNALSNIAIEFMRTL